MRSDVAASLTHLAPESAEGVILAEFVFDPNLPLFRGHFPGKPLVPGILCIEMVRQAVERARGERFKIRRVEKAKFTTEISPGRSVALEVRLTPREGLLRAAATARLAGAPAAQLSLLLAEEIPDSSKRA